MDQQLLFEELSPSQAGIITETSRDGQHTWLNGVFMSAVERNRNGRIYPLSELTTAVTSASRRITEHNGIFGELDHPQTLMVSADRISHVITELAMNGNNAVGKIKILGTPMGLIAKELAQSGVAIGVSSRGSGQVSESGDVSDFSFVTIDIVINPSSQVAYPSTVVESLEYAQNGKKILSLAESLKYDESAQKYFKKEIYTWLNNGLFTKVK